MPKIDFLAHFYSRNVYVYIHYGLSLNRVTALSIFQNFWVDTNLYTSLLEGQTKKTSMFLVVCPKITMRDVVFNFLFIDRKTGMHNLFFINRTEGNRHKHNIMDREPTVLVFCK